VLPLAFAGTNLQPSFDTAYADVLAAWRDFQARRAKNRPFVIVATRSGQAGYLRGGCVRGRGGRPARPLKSLDCGMYGAGAGRAGVAGPGRLTAGLARASRNWSRSSRFTPNMRRCLLVPMLVARRHMRATRGRRRPGTRGVHSRNPTGQPGSGAASQHYSRTGIAVPGRWGPRPLRRLPPLRLRLGVQVHRHDDQHPADDSKGGGGHCRISETTRRFRAGFGFPPATVRRRVVRRFGDEPRSHPGSHPCSGR